MARKHDMERICMKMIPVCYSCITLFFTAFSGSVFAETDRSGEGANPSHSEVSGDCPLASDSVHRELQALIFPNPDVTPRWLDKGVKAKYIPELGNISGRSKIQELTDEKDHDVCARLNEMHAKRITAEFEVPGRSKPAYVYDYGYFKAGDFYFAVFDRNPIPQPDDPAVVRSSTASGFISVYDANLNLIGGFQL